MLNENIRTLRKAKGYSQEALADRLNVVRQTISKWETGISVPDSALLMRLSEVLETPVGVLLGESIAEAKADELALINEKLERIQLQYIQSHRKKRKILCRLLILLCITVAVGFALLSRLRSPYLTWDYRDPETAVVGVALHAVEWLFVRIAPILAAGALIALLLLRRKVKSDDA